MKKLFAVAVVLMLVLTSVCALADWPERSIELIVPANPGGDTDANARALAAALNEEMGWNVIVTNMAGGSGAVAFEDCLSNPDDGYRFVFYHSGACITQMLGMYEEFNVLDDFKLAGMPFLDYSNAFVINTANEKFSDLESMVAYMKDHPLESYPDEAVYGLLRVHVLPGGRRIVYRAGMIYGGASFVGYDPTTRTLVVILRNVTSWPDRRGFDVMESLANVKWKNGA